MSSQDYWFAHPLLGAHDGWSGFQLNWPSTCGGGDIALSQLANARDIQSFDPRTPWLVPAFEAGCYPTLWEERAITVFSGDHKPQPGADAVASLEASLRQNKQKVCLSVIPAGHLPATGTWDYIQITASHARSLPPYTLLGLASRTGIVATGLQTSADRDWLLKNACTLTTDEYLLARPNSADRHADLTRLKLLKLLTLIEGDAHNEALEAVFRDESKLAYSLLRLVNCAALAPRDPIISFGQAINLLGRRQLRRWLQLLVYADPENSLKPNPLLPKAAARGRLLEQMAKTLSPEASNESSDTAFMIGTFSLLDALLNMPMQEVLQQLPLNDESRRALLAHEGPLGTILSIIDAADRRQYPTAIALLQTLGINPQTFLDAQLDALSWASKIPERN